MLMPEIWIKGPNYWNHFWQAYAHSFGKYRMLTLLMVQKNQEEVKEGNQNGGNQKVKSQYMLWNSLLKKYSRDNWSTIGFEFYYSPFQMISIIIFLQNCSWFLNRSDTTQNTLNIRPQSAHNQSCLIQFYHGSPPPLNPGNCSFLKVLRLVRRPLFPSHNYNSQTPLGRRINC